MTGHRVSEIISHRGQKARCIKLPYDFTFGIQSHPSRETEAPFTNWTFANGIQLLPKETDTMKSSCLLYILIES